MYIMHYAGTASLASMTPMRKEGHVLWKKPTSEASGKVTRASPQPALLAYRLYPRWNAPGNTKPLSSEPTAPLQEAMASRSRHAGNSVAMVQG